MMLAGKWAVNAAAVVGAAWLAGATLSSAQDAPPPPPPPPPQDNKGAQPPPGPGKGDRDDGDRDHHRGGPKPGGPSSGMPGGFSGGFSRSDWDRGGGDMFKGLPEEDRQRVREAFEKAWQDPDVNAARDRLSKANEDFRQALHLALKKADPEVVKILEKVRPPGGFPGGPRMPDANDPEFPRLAILRLAGEVQMWWRMDRRDGNTQPMHEKIMQMPAVQEAVRRIQSAPAEQRPDAWKQLREAYLNAARTEYAKAFGRLPWDRDRDRGMGGGGPGGGGDRGDRPAPAPRPPQDGPRPPSSSSPGQPPQPPPGPPPGQD